jgi:hypothetical protein
MNVFRILPLLVFVLCPFEKNRAEKAETSASSIWVEAENAVRHNFIYPGVMLGLEENGNGASGGRYLGLNLVTKEAKNVPNTYFAEYEFSVAVKGSYRLWVAASPQDQDWASPLWIRLDDQDFLSLAGKTSVSEKHGVPDYFVWFSAGTFPLDAGKHRLKVEVRSARKMNSDRVAFLDAFCLTTDTTFNPSGNHPRYSPYPEWNEFKKGINFKEYLAKLEMEIYWRQMKENTQEDQTTEAVAEVRKKIMARALKKTDAIHPPLHELGLHGMEAPYIEAGKDTLKIQEVYDLLGKSGVDLLRAGESCWHRLGPDFNQFEQLDYQVNSAWQRGIRSWFIMGYPPAPFAFGPGLSAVKKEHEETYRTYIRTVLARYRDKGAVVVEVANEVDASSPWWREATPEMYVQEVKMVKEEAMKINPQIQVTAFGATYSRREGLGLPTDGRAFVRQCFALGIDRYADAYSLHYTWPLSEQDFVAFFRKQIAEVKSKKPLINSEECGYAQPYDVIKLFARNFYVHGMKQVIYFHVQDLYENATLLYGGLFDREWNPKRRLLAYAAASDAMRDRELVGMATPAEGVEAYVLSYPKGSAIPGPRYALVLWKNSDDTEERYAHFLNDHPVKLAPSTVPGLTQVVSGLRWNLDPILLDKKSDKVEISDEPVIIYTDALPQWKLMSAGDWLIQQKPRNKETQPPLPISVKER